MRGNVRKLWRPLAYSFPPPSLSHARGSVQVVDHGVRLRALIVQLKIVPPPLYLEKAGDAKIRAAMVSLRICIRNNAATNIFNGGR